MPLYEYVCGACAHRFEVIQKFSDPPIETCPKCGQRVRKALSSPAIQFKGSGWYITDYAKKGAGEPEKGADAPAAGTGEGGSEKPGAAATAATPASDGGEKASSPKSSTAAKDSKGS